MANLFPRDWLYHAVASHASREWPHTVSQIEAQYYFGGLPPAVSLSHPIAVTDGAVLQQAAVAREQDAMFSRGDSDELGIGVTAPVQGIEAEHSQVRSELTQMNVEHELWIAQRLRPHTQFWRNVHRFEHRVDADTVSVPNDTREV